MSVEIRSPREDELTDYLRVVRYVFSMSMLEDDQDKRAKWQFDPERAVCAFVDGELVSTFGAYDFTVQLNGTPVPLAGVTNVGTLPGFRGRGFVRELVTQGLADARERGESCSMLWASFGGIYQRFGYGLASALVKYQWDPRYGQLTGAPSAGGSMAIVTLSEGREIAEQVHGEYVRPRNLMIVRGERDWQGIFEPESFQTKYQRMAIYRNAAGEPRGFMLLRNRDEEDALEPGPNQFLTVNDFTALDVDAYRGMWEFLASHDLVREVTMERVPEDDPAALMLLEPRTLHRRTGDAMWLRVADAELALGQRPYGAAGTLTLRVVDEICDWNAGTYHIESDGVESRVKRVDADADLVVPVERLSQLISGYASASELSRLDLIEVGDASVLSTADAMFATAYRPFCQDGF
jgi:predicted acetyltransferase